MGSVATLIGATRNTALFSAPFLTGNALPADTVLFGTPWGSNWVDRGFTQEGIELSMEIDRSEIMVDQLLDPALMPISSRTVKLSGNLAEMTPANLKLGFGQGTITNTAPGSGVRGHDDWDLSATVEDDYNSWGLDVQSDGDGEAFRIFVPKGLAVGSVTSTFGDPSDNAKVPIEIQALPDTSTTPTRILKVRDIIPAV